MIRYITSIVVSTLLLGLMFWKLPLIELLLSFFNAILLPVVALLLVLIIGDSGWQLVKMGPVVFIQDLAKRTKQKKTELKEQQNAD